MKKVTAACLFCAFIALSSTLLNAQPPTGFWDSDFGDFVVGAWLEAFDGGGEGQPGNMISAGGPGFLLSGVELSSVTSRDAGGYDTIYTGGILTLYNDPVYPWYNEAVEALQFAASIDEILVTSYKEYSGETLVSLSFSLQGEGEFLDYPGYDIVFTAEYSGAPTAIVESHLLIVDGQLVIPPVIVTETTAITDTLASATLDITGPLDGILDAILDVIPGSCSNPLNTKSKGVLPVAVLGTAEFDASVIDPASITLEGVAPVRSALEDVATSYETHLSEETGYECTEFGPDGYLDLVLKFYVQDILEMIDNGEVVDRSEIELTLTGSLNDGASFQGHDTVILLKKPNW